MSKSKIKKEPLLPKQATTTANVAQMPNTEVKVGKTRQIVNRNNAYFGVVVILSEGEKYQLVLETSMEAQATKPNLFFNLCQDGTWCMSPANGHIYPTYDAALSAWDSHHKSGKVHTLNPLGKSTIWK
jgi:hypothetical protein